MATIDTTGCQHPAVAYGRVVGKLTTTKVDAILAEKMNQGHPGELIQGSFTKLVAMRAAGTTGERLETFEPELTFARISRFSEPHDFIATIRVDGPARDAVSSLDRTSQAMSPTRVRQCLLIPFRAFEPGARGLRRESDLERPGRTCLGM